MRIGLDLSMLGPMPTGVGRYASCLLEALLEHPGIETVDGYAHGHHQFGKVTEHARLRLHPGDDERRVVWMHRTLPRAVRRDAPDLFHFPNYLAPANFDRPYVVTVHDMTVFDFPSFHPLKRRIANHLLLRRSLHRARGIIAVSGDTKRQVLKRWPDLEPRITVVPEAALGYMQRVTDRDELEEVRTRYGLPERFILSPGGADPRKNLPAMLAAMARLRAAGFPHVLALTSPEARWPKVDGFVHDLGYVSDYCLRTLYSLADATLYPSWYEGFGLPPLESFACGTPVVASRAGAIPEVCGDAALLVDPRDAAGLADALRLILTDPAVAADLVRKGTARAAQFTWTRAAAQTVDAYRAAMR